MGDSVRPPGSEAAHEPRLDSSLYDHGSESNPFKEVDTSLDFYSVARENMEQGGWTLWMLTVCAGLSGSLFGYDTGYMYVYLYSWQLLRTGQYRLRSGPSTV